MFVSSTINSVCYPTPVGYSVCYCNVLLTVKPFQMIHNDKIETRFLNGKPGFASTFDLNMLTQLEKDNGRSSQVFINRNLLEDGM